MSDDDLRQLRATVESTASVFPDDTDAACFGEFVVERIDELLEADDDD